MFLKLKTVLLRKLTEMTRVCQLYYLLFCVYKLIECTEVTISNTMPRLDTKGNIIDAHDGKLIQFDDYKGIYFYYALGYGLCTELNGTEYCPVFINQNSSKVVFKWLSLKKKTSRSNIAATIGVKSPVTSSFSLHEFGSLVC